MFMRPFVLAQTDSNPLWCPIGSRYPTMVTLLPAQQAMDSYLLDHFALGGNSASLKVQYKPMTHVAIEGRECVGTCRRLTTRLHSEAPTNR